MKEIRCWKSMVLLKFNKKKMASTVEKVKKIMEKVILEKVEMVKILEINREKLKNCGEKL